MTHAPPLPDLGQLSDAEKDALNMALRTQLDAALAANAELMAKVEALTARVPCSTRMTMRSLSMSETLSEQKSARGIGIQGFVKSDHSLCRSLYIDGSTSPRC